MLCDRKTVPVDRVAAFLKRLSILALNADTATTMGLLSISHYLLRKYPAVRQLLDSDRTGVGKYIPELEDPQHCNAMSSTLWESALLMNHYHPIVSKTAKEVANLESSLQKTNMTSSTLRVSDTARDVYQKYDFTGLKFNPPYPNQKIHPLASKVTDQSKPVFVKPSTRYPTSPFLTEIQENIDSQTKSLPNFKTFIGDSKAVLRTT